MKYFMFIILLLSLELNAQLLKLTSFENDGLTSVHLRFISKKTQFKPDNFMQNIRVESKNKLLYEIQPNLYLGKKPKFIFITKDLSDNDSINIYVKFENGKIIQQNFIVKSIKISKKISLSKVSKLQKKLSNILINDSIVIDKAVKKVYPKLFNPIKNKIDLSMSKGFGIHKKIPIKIKSDIRLESIAIFTDANNGAMIAFIKVPKNAIINYTLFSNKLNSREIRSVTVVAKGKDGNYYKTVKTLSEYDGGFCCG